MEYTVCELVGSRWSRWYKQYINIMGGVTFQIRNQNQKHKRKNFKKSKHMKEDISRVGGGVKMT